MKNIYFNHDGNTDDLVSLLLLLQAPDINLIGVSAIDGDGDVVASCEASRKIIDRFNTFNHKLEVAMSNSQNFTTNFLKNGDKAPLPLTVFQF